LRFLQISRPRLVYLVGIFVIQWVCTDKSVVINSMLLAVTDISAINKHMRNRSDRFFRSSG
jgi:hypothetical protein